MSLDRSSPSASGSAASLMTLRIIIAALAMGVITFAVVAIVQNLGKPHTIGSNFDPMGISMLAFGLAALPLGVVLPRVLFAAGRRAPALTQLPNMTPEELRIATIQQRIQTSAIVGSAIFEGAAFASVFAYMQSREIVHLALAAVLLMGILANLPTAGSYERRIEEELRRADEEKALERSDG